MIINQITSQIEYNEIISKTKINYTLSHGYNRLVVVKQIDYMEISCHAGCDNSLSHII